MASSDTRSRGYCVMLYPEDPKQMETLDYIINNYDSYAYITHDKDVTEFGEIKKSHIHVVVQFHNARYLTSVCNEIGLEENYIQKCRNIDNALEYLMHLNANDKYSYELEEVKGTTDLLNKLKRQLMNVGKDETEKGLELLEFIYGYGSFMQIGAFINYAAKQGKWDVVRRNYSMFRDIIQEVNYKYCSKPQETDL